MSYAQLDMEEKMRMAKEYALLIGSEMKTPFTIIAELSRLFYLTPDEAIAAYLESQQTYPDEWRKTRKQKFIKLIFGFFFSLIVSAAMLFMGQEQVFFIHWAMGIMFSLFALGILVKIILIYKEERQLKNRHG